MTTGDDEAYGGAGRYYLESEMTLNVQIVILRKITKLTTFKNRPRKEMNILRNWNLSRFNLRLTTCRIPSGVSASKLAYSTFVLNNLFGVETARRNMV